jgi:hypothetical protein
MLVFQGRDLVRGCIFEIQRLFRLGCPFGLDRQTNLFELQIIGARHSLLSMVSRELSGDAIYASNRLRMAFCGSSIKL